MFNLLKRYTHWLHTQWPAGHVEKLPEVGENGETSVTGIRIIGDLSGIPLLKFSSETATQAVHAILAEPEFTRVRGQDSAICDVAIIGAGVAGVSAAIEAKRAGLSFKLFEAAQPFSTIANFPKAKPIFTYPTEMVPSGGLQFPASANVKEALFEELQRQCAAHEIPIESKHIERIERSGEIFILHAGDKTTCKARRVLVAIGRSGNFRKLGVPGEESGKVSNRLHDPKEFAGRDVLVVGGGDSALETAIALGDSGARVTLSYRKPEFARPKPGNIERIAQLSSEKVRLAMGSIVRQIAPESVTLKLASGEEETLPNTAVFTMLGREASLDFFRRSGIAIRNEWHLRTLLACLAFLIFCTGVFHWKSPHQELPLQSIVKKANAFPYNVPKAIDSLGEGISTLAKREGNILYTIKRGLGNPSFYYTLTYCTCVVIFGLRRIRRRGTPYVKVQTLTLMVIQCLPLFILPEIILPWMGRNGWFEMHSPLRWLADNLFETYDGALGHERAYWRSYGFILAFPLNVYNVFTDHPLWLWLAICFVQTFVIIPLIIWRWGKGAYCGWICSCGALAETLGDTHRQKMPHGTLWNRLNMVGQVTLLFSFIILGLRIAGWIWPGTEEAPSMFVRGFHALFEGIPFLNYGWSVDIFLAGILGVGLYFWFSGRVWCRFACPLAALMHIYARFSKFRIFSTKSKCISCNVCTSVCHQGIDVMNFANKGKPMQDPECVRCSACVQQCPTGVLSFGRLEPGERIVLDQLAASPVQIRE